MTREEIDAKYQSEEMKFRDHPEGLGVEGRIVDLKNNVRTEFNRIRSC
jgi:hypothetical protein